MIDLTTDKVWEEDVREVFLEGARVMKTDGIFSNTLYRLVQEIDSDLANNKPISHRLQQIPNVLASKRYNDTVMKNFTDKEKEMATLINEKTLSLMQIARLEEDIREKEEYEKKKAPKENVENRLPNEHITIKEIYGVSENKRGRLL